MTPDPLLVPAALPWACLATRDQHTCHLPAAHAGDHRDGVYMWTETGNL